jgi:hypothetical protein
VGLFCIGFFWKIILNTTQFKEYFPDDEDFFNHAKENEYDKTEMDRSFYATEYEVYKKTITHYHPKMVQVNISILISFYAILLIVIAKIVNEFEKFIHSNENYFSYLDIILGIFAILGIIGAIVLFRVVDKEATKIFAKNKEKKNRKKSNETIDKM